MSWVVVLEVCVTVVYYRYMASIVGKRRGKQTYYYLVESARVQGKPRIVSQQYLGSAEEVMAKLSETRRGSRIAATQAVRGSGGGVVGAATAGLGRHCGRGGAPGGRGRAGGHLSGAGVCEPGRGPVLQAGLRRLVGHHGGGRFTDGPGVLDHRRFWDAMAASARPIWRDRTRLAADDRGVRVGRPGWRWT